MVESESKETAEKYSQDIFHSLKMKIIANWKMNLPTPNLGSWTESFYQNVNLEDSINSSV